MPDQRTAAAKFAALFPAAGPPQRDRPKAPSLAEKLRKRRVVVTAPAVVTKPGR